MIYERVQFKHPGKDKGKSLEYTLNIASNQIKSDCVTRGIVLRVVKNAPVPIWGHMKNTHESLGKEDTPTQGSPPSLNACWVKFTHYAWIEMEIANILFLEPLYTKK